MHWMIADFRGNNLDRNMRKDPNHAIRCEMCWKPLYPEAGNVKNVIVIDDDNFELPNTEAELSTSTSDVPIGPRCYTALRKSAKAHGFIVKVNTENV
jgi:hypothetical protein